MTLDEVTRLQQKCIKALDIFGASPAVRKFCLEVVEYEEETAVAILRMNEKLQQINLDSVENLGLLWRLIQSFTNDFKTWNRTVDSLVTSGSSLPPIQPTHLQGRNDIQAPVSMTTKNLQIEEGDLLVITDASQPNTVKVKTSDGKEDSIPILAFILPSSDKTITSLLQRLHIQLLSVWTDCLTQAGKILLHSTKNAFHFLKVSERELLDADANGSSIISKLEKLNEILRRVEGKLSQRRVGKDIAQSKETVANLSKVFGSYQLFFEYWNNFRLLLKGRKPRPIYIFENLEDFKHHVSNDKNLRLYTTAFTVEAVEIREEVVHVPMDDDFDASSYGGGGSYRQAIAAEQLTSTSHEEKKRYIIRSVKDPRTGISISLQEAIQEGIIEMMQGLYVNPDTNEVRPIAVALDTGHIVVDYVTKSRSIPKTQALGLITVRDRIESQKYTITSVVDATTAEKVDLTEAKKRGLVNSDASTFIINTSGEEISIEDAVEAGWVLVQYDAEEPEEEQEVRVRTYAIRAVVDQRLKKRVPFLEAVQRRLVDKETGNFYNNLTGETVHVLEAIRRGFLKAKLIEDPTKLDIDTTNKVVDQSIHKMKNLITGLSALSAMRSANRISTSSSTSSTGT